MARKKVVRSEWREYLNLIAPVDEYTQMQFVDRVLDAHPDDDISLDQTTVSNWRRGTYSPSRAPVIKAVAEAFGREPLEALAAAGLVELDWVVKSLSRNAIHMLAKVGMEPTKR